MQILCFFAISLALDVIEPSVNETSTLPKSGNYKINCDAVFSNSLCLRNGAHVVLPPATPSDLRARFSFDSGLPIDSSGNGYHGVGELISTPGCVPNSSAAQFSQNNYVSADIGTLGNTFTFLLTLMRQDKNDMDKTVFCPIVSYGPYTSQNSIAIAINAALGSVQITVGSGTEVEAFESNACLLLNNWYRIGLIVDNSNIALYINGIVDSYHIFKQGVITSKQLLYIGGSEYQIPILTCTSSFIMDDILIYDKALTMPWMIADAGTAYDTLASQVQLSCVKCTKIQAQEGCMANFHLCTQEEYQSIASTIIYKLGLKNRISYVHTLEADDINKSGIGVCCSD